VTRWFYLAPPASHEESVARDHEGREKAGDGGVLFLVEHGQDEVLDGDVVVLSFSPGPVRGRELVEPVRDAGLPLAPER